MMPYVFCFCCQRYNTIHTITLSNFLQASVRQSKRANSFGSSMAGYDKNGVFEVISVQDFVEPFNCGLVTFEKPKDNESGHQQLHLSLSALKVNMSAPVFTTLMDFVGGNLSDMKRSTEGNVEAFKETRYQEEMCFGPPNGSSVTFRLTLAVPTLECMMEAHPREWVSSEPKYVFTPASEANELLPLFNIDATNFIMSLSTFDSGDTFMNICTTGIQLMDLRVGYRYEKCVKTLFWLL